MGLANWLTTLRILLIPVFVTLLVYRRPREALLVFCRASLTDMLDGYIARSRGSQSRLGAFLDPVADKLLLTSAFVTLTHLKVIPLWLTAVGGSPACLFAGVGRGIHVSGGTVHPAPTWIGKTSTVCQMAAVLAAMLAFFFRVPTIPTLFAWLAALFTVASGFQYLVQGLKQLNPPAGVAGRS